MPPLEVSFDGVTGILELRALLELETWESPSVETLELFRPKSPMLETGESLIRVASVATRGFAINHPVVQSFSAVGLGLLTEVSERASGNGKHGMGR